MVSDKLLMNRRPDLYAELHPTMNIIDTTNLSYGSDKKVWWQCRVNDEHYWAAKVYSRSVLNSGCSICLGQKRIHGINDLSVENPTLFEEIHPVLNEENGIDIYTLSPVGRKKVWWQCREGHEWQAIVSERAKGSSKCPECSKKRLSEKLLKNQHPKLFEELHKELNERHNIDVDNFTTYRNEKVWWQCQDYEDHVYFSMPKNRIGKRKDGCSICAGIRIKHGFNDLSTTHPLLYKQLHPTLNKDIDTSVLYRSFKEKVWWLCSEDPEHIWSTKVDSRIKKPTGCPRCHKYRNESEFRELFNCNSLGLDFIEGVVIGQRKLFKSDLIQIDILNEENNICIEYDGYFSHGGNPIYKKTKEYCFARDMDTTNTLLEAGYKVVRIREKPLDFLELKHENLFQIECSKSDEKRDIIDKIIEALIVMGI